MGVSQLLGARARGAP